jgi:hypothetical protein
MSSRYKEELLDKDDDEKIPLYSYLVMDEILYSMEKNKDAIFVKGGTLKTFAIPIENLDENDPNRAILLEILKKYLDINPETSVKDSLKYITNLSKVDSHTQLKNMVELAYTDQILEILNERRRMYKTYFMIIVGSIILLALLYFFFARRASNQTTISS